jgi:hypothetical protein
MLVPTDNLPASEDVLFGHLPHTIFGLLASPAKRAYARLILSIYRNFFGDNFMSFLRREDVLAFIELELERSADMRGDFAPDSHNGDVSQNPAIAYRKMLESGWLVEYKQGYIVVVDLDASVAMLLESLSSIEEGEAVHFGGTISAIESVVEKLGEQPAERASSLADSAQRARKFQQHLAAVISSLRGYEKLILSRPDPAHMLARFFDDFVENLLIADYKALKTRNNPFRHRDRIIAAIGLYESDDQMLVALAQGYLDQGLATTDDGAIEKVQLHLGQVKSVFLRVEDRLEEIDAFRIRLERRITRTITYMSQVDSSLPARLTAVIQGLSTSFDDWEAKVPLVSGLARPVRCWGPDNLAVPRGKRSRVAPTAVIIQEDDPVITAYNSLRRDYLASLVIPPEKVESYLQEAFADGASSLEAHQFSVSTPVEALMMQRLRMLGLMKQASPSGEFRIVVEPNNLVTTEWTTASNFRIERLAPETEGAANAV